MSCLKNDTVVHTEYSKNSNGGTEQVQSILMMNVPAHLRNDFSIYFSRVRNISSGEKNIFYAHDVADDVESKICSYHDMFVAYVFVSYFQMEEYVAKFNLPRYKCYVIENPSVVSQNSISKDYGDKLRFVYHTTPHRGLLLLDEIWQKILEYDKNVTLDIFSSFRIYGQNDPPELLQYLKKIKSREGVTLHGSRPHDEVINFLQNDAHIFLYPCIWKETSCISMIESMKSNCFVIHPSYGALVETGCNLPQSRMFRFTEIRSEFIENCVEQALCLIDMWKNEREKFVQLSSCKIPYKHDVEHFANSWEKLLEKLKEK